ncbi:hypothetical protein ACNVED_15545 (plasmid) [Legionella sp. D16C41]|uniref:hypothetical protein n=1 Tax=Legionella sp. D16C41 TaxID=3402688 RepID=UPI003AF4E1ED
MANLILSIFLFLVTTLTFATEINNLRVLKKGQTVYIRNPFSKDEDLVITLKKGLNNQIDFSSVLLIPHSNGMTEVELKNGLLIHMNLDSSTPWRINNNVIGGNHGVGVIEITSKMHGLNTTAIGSEWFDLTGKRFYLIKILDTDRLWFLPDNTDIPPIWHFSLQLTGESLVRKSNKKTVTLKIEALEIAQLRPSLRTIKQEYLIDGKTPLVDNQPIRCSFLKIIDENEIVNPGAVLIDVLKHPGSERNFIADDLDAVIHNKIKYKFYPNGAMVANYHATALQSFNLNFMGFIQSAKLFQENSDKLEYYIPKTLPFKIDGRHYDFKSIQDLSHGIHNNIFFGLEWRNIAKANNLPDRFLQFLSKIENEKLMRKVGFVIGYSAIKGITKPEKRNKFAKIAYRISPFLKNYPGALNPSRLENKIPAGSKFHCFAYQQYFDLTQQKEATSIYWHREGNSYIVYADYHHAIKQTKLEFPAFMVGKKINLVEKTDSVEINLEPYLTKNNIDLTINGNYGYIVLRIQ